jgi:hypothetical protein
MWEAEHAKTFSIRGDAAGLSMQSSAQPPDSPALPATASAIQVSPDGALQLKYRFLAVGKQIYNCERSLEQELTPAATLYDLNSNLKIRHAWTTADGKSTVKANGAMAKHFPAPDGASIDWLKLAFCTVTIEAWQANRGDPN